MAWASGQWDVCCGLLEHGFDGGRLGAFDKATADSYRILLDKYEPPAVIAAIQGMVDAGRQYRPLPGEVVGALRADPSAPTFAEALRDLRRALAVRQSYFAKDDEKERVCVEWLEQHSHELVARFFEAQSYGRLSRLPIDDPDYGQLEIKRLREDWEAFTERAEDRRAAGLPAGTGTRRRQLGPRKPDFAAALPPAPADAAASNDRDRHEPGPAALGGTR